MTQASPRLLTTGFALVMLGNIAWFMAFATFFLLPRFLITELDASEAQTGWVMASFGLLSLAALPFVGGLTDRFGRRPFLITGALVMVVSALLFTQITEIGPAVYVLRMLQGLSFALWFVSSSSLVVDIVPSARRGAALGLFGISTLSTHALAPAIAEWIALTWGFMPVFLLSAGWGLLAAGIAFVLPGRRRQPGADEQPARSNLTLLRRPEVGLIVLASLLCGFGFGAALVFSQPLALQRGLTMVTAFLVAHAVTSIAVRVLFSRLTDHPSRRLVVLPSIFFMGSGVIWLAFMQSMPEYVIAGALMGLGHSLTYPTMNALLINRLRLSEHGRGMSLFVGGFNAGMIVAQMVLGWLTVYIGLNGIFIVAGVLVWAAAPSFWGATVSRTSSQADEPRDPS